MKKAGVVITSLIFIFMLSTLVLADTNLTTSTSGEEASITKAYQCLESQLNNKTAVSLQEAVFGELALGEKTKLSDKITSEEKQNCWPKAACTLKDTAQVLLLYNKLGKDTTGIKNWILSRNVSLSDLNWFLEVDVTKHSASNCTIKYDSTQRTINIADNMKITSASEPTSNSLGSCLTITPSGYWMQISSSCYGKSFQVSCSDDFVSTLLYQKPAGETIYVSSSTHSAPSSGTTTENINAKCFKTSGTSCDYEGTLWATLALQKLGVDVSSYTPYLIALASENEQYFPSSFIYMIAGGEDQYNNIIQAQKQGKFWESTSTRYNKYYDTSLAMLAISGSAADALENAKNYLIAIQSAEGCWNNNNFKDTSFLLYSGWPRQSTSSGGSSTPIIVEQSCEATGITRACEFSYACAQAGGSILSSFTCSGAKSCCSIKVQEQTCQEKGGKICLADEQCTGSAVPSSEGSTCCLGSCDKIQISDTCTVQYGGVCKTSCSSNEQSVSGSCLSAGEVCCKSSGTPSGISWWVWLLIILIILVLLAILFRDKLRVEWFKLTSKQKPGSPPPSRPSMPQRFNPNMPPRQAYRPQMSPVSSPQSSLARKPLNQKEKELEETLRKLKEMSK